MLMFLMILLAAVPVVLFCALAAIVENRKVDATPKIPTNPSTIPPPRFFAGPNPRLANPSELPIEMLLSQIERHVRLEQAAAEAYLRGPNRDRLHAPSASTALN